MMKLFFFDIDDTLTTDGSWLRLNLAAGLSKEEDYSLYMNFYKKQISYQEWTNELASLYQHKSILTSDVANEALTSFTLKSGAAEAIISVQAAGFRPILLTGGFRVTAEAVALKLGINDYYAVSDLEFDTDKKFLNFRSDGEEGVAKLLAAKRYCDKYCVDISTCYAVGDSMNDLPLFNETRNGITFSWCKAEVQAGAQHIINDLNELPSLLNANDLHLDR